MYKMYKFYNVQLKNFFGFVGGIRKNGNVNKTFLLNLSKRK